nr:hypothetical protein [Lachnospiraceae bacterium]
FYGVASAFTGCDAFLPKTAEAVLKSPYRKINKMRRFIRAYTEGGSVFLPAGSHASSVFANLSECNCYIDLKENTEVNVGDRVRVMLNPMF